MHEGPWVSIIKVVPNPLLLLSPHPVPIRNTLQYIIIYRIMGVLNIVNIRGWGGFNLEGGN